MPDYQPSDRPSDRPDDRPDDRPEADVHVTAQWSGEPDALVAQVRARLGESERPRCVVAVSKIRPILDVLVVTTQRVLAGWRYEPDEETFQWVVDLRVGDVSWVAVTGLMDNVYLHGCDGRRTKVGTLCDADDEEPLRQALVSSGETGPPTWNLYRP